MFAHFQNARQTEHPEEFVNYIDLEIPRAEDMDNPIEDAAFLERIGANRLDSSEYELKNTATGTRFTFTWSRNISGRHFRWTFKREE